MPPTTPWKLDSMLRLLLGVFVCMYGGTVFASIYNYAQSPGPASPFLFFSVAGLALSLLGAALYLVGKRWEVETIFRQLTTLLVAFYGGMAAGAWAQNLAGPAPASAGQISIGALFFQGGLIVLTFRFLREHGMGWAEGFGLRNRRKEALFCGLVLGALFLPVGWGLQHTSSLIINNLPFWELKPQEQQAVQVLRTAASGADRLKLALVTIVLAPIAEEILFRGILFSWVRHMGFPKLALWLTATLFALVHFNLATFIPLFALATLLALLYERTGNLLAPITAHSVFNLLNFVLLFLFNSRS